MMSRSKKIMELINSKHVPLSSDAGANNDIETRNEECGSPSLLHESECLAKDQDNIPLDTAVDVVMLSDITNTPENQRHSNAMAYFENEKPSVTSSESDIDVSDHDDPSYKHQKKKRKRFVYPTSSRRSSSSSSSGSSSSSDSSSSTSSSSSDESDTTSLKPISNENISEVNQNKRNEPNIEIETSELEENETNEPNIEREINEPQNHHIEEEMESPKKKGRKRNRKPEKWQQNLNKRLKNTGQSYMSKKKQPVPARAIKPPCSDKCRLKCSEKITHSQRQEIFEAYWNIGDINQQRSFIQSCLSDVTPRYKYTNAERPKACNKAFHFIIDGISVRVCKPFFIGTLNISDRVIRTVKEKSSGYGVMDIDRRGKHTNHRTTDEALIYDIKQFIDSIPRIESHYTRQTSSREFIDGGRSISDIFRDFEESQKKNNKPSGKYSTFYNIFTKEFNISFFSPKKDQCDVCLQYKNLSDEQRLDFRNEYESHLEEKNLSRKEKHDDRCNINDTNKVLVFDLQAVLQAPRGNTSAFYYKSKLNSYNFTVTLLNEKVDDQNMKTSYTDVHNYFWNETDAKRGANEIGSCLLDCFEKICSQANGSDSKKDDLNLILYSDNCCGQNKNKYLVTLYLFAVTHLNIQSITHKYLIKGHTQNEGDNVHSLIEKQIQRNLKSGPIYSPHEYIAIIKNARKTGQKFFVHELSHDFFLDLKKLQELWGYNFNETIDKQIITWNDIKILRVQKDEPFSFFVKTSYKDTMFKKVCVRNKRKKALPLPELIPDKAYTAKQELSENKKRDIKDLIDKNLIPRFYKEYYDSIL